MSNQPKVRNIHIFGKALEYVDNQPVIQQAGDSMAVIISGLASRFGPEIKEHIKNNVWQVCFNAPDGIAVDPNDVHKLEGVSDIYIYPVVEGSGGKVGGIILGVIMIVVGVIIIVGSWGTGTPAGMAAIANGVMMIAGGAMMVYTALNTPKAQQNRADPAERASFVFNGAVNVIEQGGAVPCVYGRTITGSTVVSAGIATEEITAYTSPVGGIIAPNSAFGIVAQ